MNKTAKIYLEEDFLVYALGSLELRIPWNFKDTYPVGIESVSLGHVQLKLANGEVDGFATNAFLSSLRLPEQTDIVNAEVIL
ncbi:MAG: hypothetical protein FWG68_08680 [Defluviitaleaceae bacterium]|nr:hypothetical protein [Defluviitaleaceae bacterium]